MIRKKKIFFGWWIVIASASLNFLVGGTLIYGFTVFFNPMRNTFGWTAAATSIAFSLRGLETGLLDPLVGYLVDRLGPRKLMIFGWIIVGLGFLWMSRINTLWAFYGSFLLLATGMCFGSFVVFNTAIAHWFKKKRSRAMALMYMGFGASGALVPLLALSIERFGWRTSLVIVGITFWVIGLPLSSLIRHKPSQYGFLPDGEDMMVADIILEPKKEPPAKTNQGADSSFAGYPAKAALKTRAFWLLAFVFFFQHIATSAIMVHIVPYLESVKVPTTIAATAVTGMTLFSLIGRLGFGFLGDFSNKRHLIAIALTLQTIGVFIFSLIDVNTLWIIVPFLLVYGAGYGGPIPLRSAMLADYFGTRSYGTIFGWLALIGMLGGIASPVVAGWIFDALGSYRLAWQIFAIVTLPAIPLVILAKPPVAGQTIKLT